MSTISRQNSQKSIKLLAAQRFLYTHAKRWWTTALLLSAIIAPILSIIAIFNPRLAPYAACMAILIYTLVGLIGIKTKSLVRAAAETQEEFDCHVLDLPINPLLFEVVDRKEIVSDMSSRYIEKCGKDKLIDWYPKSLTRLSQSRATVEAQKINCWWDQSLRNNYIVAHIAIALLVCCSLVLLGLWQKLSLESFILSVIVPIIPLIQVVTDQTYKNIESKRKAMSNLQYAKTLLANHNNQPIEQAQIRSLQDAIFNHRTTAPLVFNFVYWLSREVKERIMKDSSK